MVVSETSISEENVGGIRVSVSIEVVAPLEQHNVGLRLADVAEARWALDAHDGASIQ